MLYISETKMNSAITAIFAFSILLRNDSVADTLAGMEKEMEFIIRTYFVVYVYVFASNIGCIATPVVESARIRN